jgi:4-hydroxy 2-oxovalerate aldolase
VSDRVAALVDEVGDDAQVGFHGHQNLSLGAANSVLAIRSGAVQVDACTRSFGAGSGNTPTEALVAVLDRLGVRTGIDPLDMFDVAEDVVRPVMDGECVLDRMSLIMGYAGVYSSFLRHAYRAGRALRRVRRGDPDALRGAQARRRSGGPDHRHRRRIERSPRSGAVGIDASPRRCDRARDRPVGDRMR